MPVAIHSILRKYPHKFAKSARNAYSEKLSETNQIAVITEEGHELVSSSEIVRCESFNSRCIFHLTDGSTIKSIRNLKFYEYKLCEWNFLKVHRSHMINLNYVSGHINGERVFMKDSSEVEVATRKRARLIRTFSS